MGLDASKLYRQTSEKIDNLRQAMKRASNRKPFSTVIIVILGAVLITLGALVAVKTLKRRK